jgi:23S rRNA pseudouridine2605 synthase
MATVSLLKALTNAGIGSRRRLADAIRQSRVEVNGEVIEGFNYPVNIETDRILIDKQLVDLKGEPLLYLILNKPQGILSTMKDERGRRTVTDILPRKYRRLRLYPVGRLDKDSTGLLLITNDGNLTYELTHPSFEHEKEYLVQISTKLRPSEKRKLEQGVKLEDGLTYPAVLREVKSLPPFTYSITIHEGRKRQVRRMFESIGHRVLALKRIRLGNLSLGDLKEGTTRELSTQEIQVLLRSNMPV